MRKPSDFRNSATWNAQQFTLNKQYLKQLCDVCYEWENVPETIDVRFLESKLMSRGNMIWFYDDIIGYLCLGGILGGILNPYGESITRRIIGENGVYRQERTLNDSVVIYNSVNKLSIWPLVEKYAWKLYEIDRTIDINIKAQKTPVLITCGEKQLLTVKNLYMKYEGNAPVIYANKDAFENNLSVLKTDAPYLADKLLDQRHDTLNEFLTAIGIENVGVDKKERLVTDEAQGSYGVTEMSRNIYLMPRLDAAKAINKMFGLDVRVRYRSNLPSDLNNITLQESEVLMDV